MVQQRDDTDAETQALQVLAWALGNDNRRDRLLAMTGMTPDDLRARAGSREVLGAVMGWLANHEPDLLAASEDLQIRPEQLAATYQELSR
ncbi:DUF3572 domain-containing protein [Alterisphingorhabdus coralli]|uniref:DUF3572 domain-containing protein n=1 Tax=Alterisphingorhabdus coralli TaxID=3071408 RepID=A0AA97F8H0_9SPHN|nr:DUF3572 domain-containing protein [Parasphingorhabdus sp. SCSIO 66989]WOE75217.1 DUF3572 domain-containing protein [Parasphingorhabdus sp. SCSIO 66989]